MKPPKDVLKKIQRFELIDPADLEGIEEYSEWLEAILHNACSIWEENGELSLIETRQLVERLDGLRIEIYPDEHAPPHFHVKSPNVNASFTIENCEKLEGVIGNGDYKKVLYWHRRAKLLLIECWNATRPTNCQVGKYGRGP